MNRYLIPCLGFTLVAITSFSVWAWGGKWFPSAWSLYSSCAIIFLVLGGVSLLPFSGKESHKPRWELTWCFSLAFLAYAILWCLGYSIFQYHLGEIVGSALGIFAMTAVLKTCLRFTKSILEASAVVFLFYTLGYYLGEKINLELGGLWGKLGWGFGFGGGLGAGLTYLIQLPPKSRN